MSQFPKVSGTYGAPMGRHGGTLQTERIRLFRVRLDAGGYDDGGAYWGIGAPLWCADDGDGGMQFVRAPTRAAACAALEIDPAHLVRKLEA